MKKIVIAVVIVAVLVGGGFGAWKWFSGKNDPMNEEPVIATAPVEMGNLEVLVEGFGPLLPIDEKEVSSIASGTVQRIAVGEGDRVTQGQELVILENRTLAMEVQQKQLELEQKQNQLARRLNTTPDQLNAVGAEQALKIVAPASGRLTDFTHKVKEEIDSGVSVGKIVDDSGVVIEVMTTSQVYSKIKAGDNVKVHFSEFSGELEATINELDSNPVPGEQGFSYTASILLDNPGLLKVGMKPQVIFSIPGQEVQLQGKI